MGRQPRIAGIQLAPDTCVGNFAEAAQWFGPSEGNGRVPFAARVGGVAVTLKPGDLVPLVRLQFQVVLDRVSLWISRAGRPGTVLPAVTWELHISPFVAGVANFVGGVTKGVANSVFDGFVLQIAGVPGTSVTVWAAVAAPATSTVEATIGLLADRSKCCDATVIR